DEFQDTNKAQYDLVRLLAAGNPDAPGHQNICVVGDDDQCLVAGTRIQMADGSERPIEVIAADDMVMSAYGSGRFRPARVLATARRERSDGVRITLRSGRTLISTPEHNHFAGYRRLRPPRPVQRTAKMYGPRMLPAPSRRGLTPGPTYASSLATSRSAQRAESLPQRLIVTLCGDQRGSTPMHRISLVGNDPRTWSALEGIGLSVRAAKAGSASWRFESANGDMGALLALAGRIGQVIDVETIFTARLGANEEPGATNSLPFTPAAAVRPGMVMFDAQGGYDVVTNVERVTLDGPVYDLDIAATHNFIANGIVTHNSIYGWRGAIPQVVQDFQRDFPKAKTVKLEQNYRSTQIILDAAHGVVRR
ncbi:MAG: UvrD-helicase domain-containing protein, partial [Ktedonobacterales bacterium]